MNKLIAIRIILISVFICFINYFLDAELSDLLVFLATGLGVYTSVALNKRPNLWKKTLLIVCATFLISPLLNFIGSFSETYNLTIVSISLTLNILLIIFSLVLLSTNLIFKSSGGATLETLLLCTFPIAILASHRGYRFDLAKLINELCWELQISQVYLLVTLGVIFCSLMGINLVVSNYLNSSQRKFNIFSGLTNFILIITLLSLLGYEMSAGYYNQSLTVLKNGVGEATEEGLSPIDFNQSLGSSTQATALVRLEGDYLNNPYVPMLYFRESALSQLKDNKFAISKEFDQDVSFTPPKQEFNSIWSYGETNRRSLSQEVYLLSNTKLVFGLDYPLEIRQLALPKDTDRFKSAYLVRSMVPMIKLEELKEFDIGDPKWDDRTLSHYLELHPDPRYKELAEKITVGKITKMEMALAIVDWLNENSIYTLRPNHSVAEGEDPTGKYLFGDHRGYCVHFSHATVYLMRSLGIPARVSTGYLTDFSQAKDGHSLLRMNDRHAWAEVFVTNLGWMPFDTQPKNVEENGDAPIDQNQLDELMGLIGPPETKLSDSLIEKDLNTAKDNFNFKYIFYFLIAVLLLFAIVKTWIRKSYLLPMTEDKKLRKLNLAANSLILDLGFTRNIGETRKEFAQRVNGSIPNILDSNPTLVDLIYSNKLDDYNSDLIKFNESKKYLNLKMKFLSAINPTSTIKFICGKL